MEIITTTEQNIVINSLDDITSVNVVEDIIDINIVEEIITISTPTGGYPTPATVYSVFGRTGNITALEGDYTLSQLGDVTITNPTTNQILKYNGYTWINGTDAGGITSIGLTMPPAFSVSGSPLTANGTIGVTAIGDTTQYIAGNGSLITFPVAGQAGTLIRQVRNQTGSTLTKGTVVYISGASGNKALVTKAIATGDSTSAQTFGLIQNDLANNTNGYVVVVGDIIDINTSDFTEGTQLYLSSTTAGTYTSIKQYAPNHLVYIGVVTRSHANQGTIEVKIQNGYELDELHNVSAQTPSNNNGIFYNDTTKLWEAKSITNALGFNPVPDTRIITINGTSYDLSADRTWTIYTSVAARDEQTFTATSGQTTFTVSGGYTIGLVDVYVNGNKYTPSDYTATNGTTVILNTEILTGDIISIIKYISPIGYNPVPYTGATSDVNLGTNKLITTGVKDMTTPVFNYTGGDVRFIGQTGGYSYINGITTPLEGISGNLFLSGIFVGTFNSNISNILNDFSINSNALTSISLPSLTSVGSFSLSANALTSISLPSLTSVGNFFIYSNALTTISLPVIKNIDSIDLRYNFSLTTFTIGSTLKVVIGDVNFIDCALNQSSVDNVLVRLAALDGTNGTTSYNNHSINISGGTNSAPSATGLSAKSILVLRGNTVTTN